MIYASTRFFPYLNTLHSSQCKNTESLRYYQGYQYKYFIYVWRYTCIYICRISVLTVLTVRQSAATKTSSPSPSTDRYRVIISIEGIGWARRGEWWRYLCKWYMMTLHISTHTYTHTHRYTRCVHRLMGIFVWCVVYCVCVCAEG